VLRWSDLAYRIVVRCCFCNACLHCRNCSITYRMLDRVEMVGPSLQDSQMLLLHCLPDWFYAPIFLNTGNIPKSSYVRLYIVVVRGQRYMHLFAFNILIVHTPIFQFVCLWKILYILTVILSVLMCRHLFFSVFVCERFSTFWQLFWVSSSAYTYFSVCLFVKDSLHFDSYFECPQVHTPIFQCVCLWKILYILTVILSVLMCIHLFFSVFVCERFSTFWQLFWVSSSADTYFSVCLFVKDSLHFDSYVKCPHVQTPISQYVCLWKILYILTVILSVLKCIHLFFSVFVCERFSTFWQLFWVSSCADTYFSVCLFVKDSLHFDSYFECPHVQTPISQYVCL